MTTHDPVNHPKHYTEHPSGVECIQITEHMGFCLGNAIKYIWRADLKGDAIEDLKKAVWYIKREVARREKLAEAQNQYQPSKEPSIEAYMQQRESYFNGQRDSLRGDKQ
jgi:hypothetical protein